MTEVHAAFSLVELSIVLVILGLLTGGILTGQSLIRAAELRSVTTEFSNHQTATMTFRDRYFALPGDMRNAEAFWQTMATGTCPNATAGTGTQTCNGNGDGQIDSPAAASQTGEAFTFWQHLANAGLIEGTYTGIAGGNDAEEHVLNTNAPQSKLSNVGWGILHWTPWAGNANLFDGEYGNNFSLGGTTAGRPTAAAFTPKEQWNIDTKIDDGMPATGRIVVRVRENCTNATAAPADSDNFDSLYNLSNRDIECSFIFRNAF